MVACKDAGAVCGPPVSESAALEPEPKSESESAIACCVRPEPAPACGVELVRPCYSPERRFDAKERRERPPRRYDKVEKIEGVA